jgi:hypothetical protein
LSFLVFPFFWIVFFDERTLSGLVDCDKGLVAVVPCDGPPWREAAEVEDIPACCAEDVDPGNIIAEDRGLAALVPCDSPPWREAAEVEDIPSLAEDVDSVRPLTEAMVLRSGGTSLSPCFLETPVTVLVFFDDTLVHFSE